MQQFIQNVAWLFLLYISAKKPHTLALFSNFLKNFFVSSQTTQPCGIAKSREISQLLTSILIGNKNYVVSFRNPVNMRVCRDFDVQKMEEIFQTFKGWFNSKKMPCNILYKMLHTKTLKFAFWRKKFRNAQYAEKIENKANKGLKWEMTFFQGKKMRIKGKEKNRKSILHFYGK